MAEPHWTPKMVAVYLEEAADTLHRLPNPRVGGYVSAWPEIVHDYWEAFGWHDAEVRPIPPSPKAIDQMDETLRWLWWLERDEARLVWERSTGKPWKVIAYDYGVDRTTAWRRWTYALITIAARLNAGDELEILGPDDDVRRTVTGLTSPTFTYTTAMQAEDFPEGYPASAFVVYQISAQVGRGFAARFDFPDAPQLVTLGESIAEGQAGGGTSNFPANTVMAQRYTGIAGQALSASAYLGSSASGNMRIGLYGDNAGEPGALIATTEAKAFTATSSGHWEEFTFAAPPTTVGGVKYWLACHTDASVSSRGSDGSNQNDARRLITQSYASGLPDPFGAGSSYSNTRGMKMLVWTNPP